MKFKSRGLRRRRRTRSTVTESLGPRNEEVRLFYSSTKKNSCLRRNFSLWKKCGLCLLLLLCCSLLCCFLCLLLCCHSSEGLEAYKILCFDHKASKDASVLEKYFTFTNEHSYTLLSLAYLTRSIHNNKKLWITRV